MFSLLRNGAFLGLGLMAMTSALCAQGEETKVVKATVKATPSKIEGTQELTLTLDIATSFHIYANPVGLEDLENVQTSLKVTGKTPPKSVKADFPKGKLVKDKLVGDHYIYEGKIVIPVKVVRAEGDNGPLDITVKYQACDEKRCLAPASIKIELK